MVWTPRGHRSAAVIFPRLERAPLLGILVFLWQYRSHLLLAVSHLVFLLVVLLTLGIQVLSSYNVSHVSVHQQEDGAALSSAERERYYPYLLSPATQVRTLRVEATYGPFMRPFLRGVAIRFLRERPLLGIGPGAYTEEIYRRQRDQGEGWSGLRVSTPWDPHSTYFGVLAELGWLGFCALVGLLGLGVWQLVHAIQSGTAARVQAPLLWAFLGCLLGYLMLGFDDDLLTKRWFWCVLARGGSAYRLASREPCEPRVRVSLD